MALSNKPSKTAGALAAKNAIADAQAAEATSRNVSLPTWTALNPAQLGTMFRQFEKGDFRFCVPYFESAAKYDAHLKSVSDKRFADVSSRNWEIQLISGIDEADDEAKRQQSVLKDFFDNLRFSTVDKRDMSASVGSLVEWIASAVFLGYSAIAAEFFPALTADGVASYHAHFCGVPVRFFEARERFLRLRRDWFDYDGEDIDHASGEWIVASYGKTPLVFATMILHMLKVQPLEDWTHAVERFGMPFVVLKTTAKKGSAEWQSTVDAARKIGSNFSGVFGKDVEVNASNIAQSAGAPHSSLVEYLDRQLSILWRGGDMSTESRAGVDVGGISAQNDERSLLAEADSVFVEEVIDLQVVRPFLRRVFGDGVKQKAYFRFIRSKRENVSMAREKLAAARECGLAISKAWAYEILGIESPHDGEETIVFQAQNPLGQAGTANALANADDDEKADESGENGGAIKDAKEKQWEAFLLALAELNDVPEADFPEALKAFQEKFPQAADEVLSRNDVAEILAQSAVEEMRKELGA